METVNTKYSVHLPTDKGVKIINLSAEGSHEAVEIAIDRATKRGHKVDRDKAGGSWNAERQSDGRVHLKPR